MDKLFIDNFRLCSTKQPTVQAGLVQPFAGSALVGGDQPQRHVVDVETRAHRFIQNAQAQADTPRPGQAKEGLDQPAQVVEEIGLSRQLPRVEQAVQGG